MRTIAFLIALFTGSGLEGAFAQQPVDPHLVVRPSLPASGLHVISGYVRGILGSNLVVQLRGGQMVRVDASEAMREERVTNLFVSRPVAVFGHYVSAGVFDAWSIERARASPAGWPPDR